MLGQLLFSFLASAARGGIALVAFVGLLVVMADQYLGLPVAWLGWGLFFASTVLFVLVGGMRGA